MTRTRFRQMIVAYVVATVAAVAAMWFPQYSQALADAYADEPMLLTADSVAMGYAMVAVLPYLLIAMLGVQVAVIAGLFLFKRWARSLSLWLTVAGLLLVPFAGATLAWGLESALWEASTLLWGAILVVAYWSPVRAAFGDADALAHAEM